MPTIIALRVVTTRLIIENRSIIIDSDAVLRKGGVKYDAVLYLCLFLKFHQISLEFLGGFVLEFRWFSWISVKHESKAGAFNSGPSNKRAAVRHAAILIQIFPLYCEPCL